MTPPERPPRSAEPVADPADAFDRRRRVALERARSDAQAHSRYGGPEVLSVGFRAFSPGRLAVALVGMPDDDGLARLYSLTRYLGDLARVELVVDLAGFRGCSRALLRVLNQMRGDRRPPGARSELLGWSPDDHATGHTTTRGRRRGAPHGDAG